MAFATGYLADPANVKGGELFGDSGISLTAEKGDWSVLQVGRFAQDISGTIQQMDATATPNVVGVVMRVVTNAVEDSGTLDPTLLDHANYCRMGLVTVNVKSGESAPDIFDAVQAYNVADGDQGLAVASGGVATNAEFVKDLGGDVWLVRLV